MIKVLLMLHGQALAQGSTEQASSIQELTESITGISNQIKQNAVDANLARELTAEVMRNAEKGNAQMIEMQESMMTINLQGYFKYH